MNGIVVFGSEYGATEKYAAKLSKELDFDLVSAQDFNSDMAKKYNICIHGGGLYAGGLAGLKNTLKAIPANPEIVLILFTVGLADPLEQENIDSIRKSLKRQLPSNLYHENRIFHLRGSIEYSKLSLTHKTMMTLLCKKTQMLPKEKQTAETRALVETFGKEVDFVDFDALKPLVSYVQHLQ